MIVTSVTDGLKTDGPGQAAAAMRIKYAFWYNCPTAATFCSILIFNTELRITNAAFSR